jgi:putative peptide zinc metalloprotease protein
MISPLATKVRAKRKGVRTVSVSGLLVASVVALFLFVPAPLWTRAEGVCWPPERSQVRAGTAGFITRVLVEEETLVRAGQALIEAEDPFLPARVAVLEAHLRELESRLAAELVNDRVAAAIVREEIHAVNADLDRAQDRAADLTIRSPVDGIFMVSNIDDLPGRYVRQGELVAYVVNPPDLTARVVVPQSDIGLVRARTRGVEVMLAEWGADAYPSTILREVPAGTNRLPTAALGPVGGGPIPVDPRDSEGMTTIGRVFHFELELPQVVDAAFLGSRVFVRFDHGFEPIGFRLYRALRRLLLSQFGI